jgi:hypothetical protein
MVLTKSFTVLEGTMPVMDVSTLPAGTYFVKAYGKNYSSTGKIVVIH